MVHCFLLHTLYIDWGYTSTGETQSTGDTNFSRSSAWSTVSYYTHLISTGETQSTGDINIGKQTVWETLKHNQLGIHINRGYTVNWGYSFGSSSAWSTVSHYTHLISTGEAQSIGDIGISKQWSCQKFGGTCPASSMAPAPTLPGPDGELTALLHIPSCIWGREWGQGRPRHSRIQQIGDGTPFSIRTEWSKARRRGHSGLTQRTSAVYAI